ncbi:hypothetical protein PSPO01_12131 [Paraphaeosphaeria sporulosa]
MHEENGWYQGYSIWENDSIMAHDGGQGSVTEMLVAVRRVRGPGTSLRCRRFFLVREIGQARRGPHKRAGKDAWSGEANGRRSGRRNPHSADRWQSRGPGQREAFVDMSSVARGLRPTSCDLRPATCDLRPATCDLRRSRGPLAACCVLRADGAQQGLERRESAAGETCECAEWHERSALGWPAALRGWAQAQTAGVAVLSARRHGCRGAPQSPSGLGLRERRAALVVLGRPVFSHPRRALACGSTNAPSPRPTPLHSTATGPPHTSCRQSKQLVPSFRAASTSLPGVPRRASSHRTTASLLSEPTSDPTPPPWLCRRCPRSAASLSGAHREEWDADALQLPPPTHSAQLHRQPTHPDARLE